MFSQDSCLLEVPLQRKPLDTVEDSKGELSTHSGALVTESVILCLCPIAGRNIIPHQLQIRTAATI